MTNPGGNNKSKVRIIVDLLDSSVKDVIDVSEPHSECSISLVELYILEPVILQFLAN